MNKITVDASYYAPTLQTKFNIHGNCLSAVISTLFPVSIDEVPAFVDSEDLWAVELSEWLSKNFGKYIIPIKMDYSEEVQLFRGSYVITTINSDNPVCERHAVISKDGRIVFDPMIGEVNRDITEDMDASYFAIGDIRYRY